MRLLPIQKSLMRKLRSDREHTCVIKRMRPPERGQGESHRALWLGVESSEQLWEDVVVKSCNYCLTSCAFWDAPLSMAGVKCAAERQSFPASKVHQPGWWGIQFGENIVGKIRPQLLSRWEMGVHKHERWISKDMWEDQEQSLNICEIKFCHCRTLCKKSFRIPEELSYHSKLRVCVPLWSHLTWGLQQIPSILKRGRTLLWFVYWKLLLCWI